MVSITKERRPKTLIRKLFRLLDILRVRNQSQTVTLFTQAVRSTNHAGEVYVALQNEDTAEDVVVITSLDKLPFCCHADLVLMNKEQLLTAASILNERLPAVLRIDMGRSDFYIRNSIEFIVGLNDDPPAKSATPSRKFISSGPISPLAKHSRFQNSQLFASHSLLGDVTEEEDESDPESVVTPHPRHERPLQGRRILVQGQSTQPHPTSGLTPEILNSNSTGTRRITRSQSIRTPKVHRAPSERASRSYSERMSPPVAPCPSLAYF